MTGVLEHFDDKDMEHGDDKVLEHYVEKTMETCDGKSHGAF